MSGLCTTTTIHADLVVPHWGAVQQRRALLVEQRVALSLPLASERVCDDGSEGGGFSQKNRKPSWRIRKLLQPTKAVGIAESFRSVRYDLYLAGKGPLYCEMGEASVASDAWKCNAL